MSDSTSMSLINEWTQEYTKYFTQLSTNKDPAHITASVDAETASIVEQWNWYTDRVVSEQRANLSFAKWFQRRIDEIKRLNEFYERFGDRPVVAESNKRPGSRYLP